MADKAAVKAVDNTETLDMTITSSVEWFSGCGYYQLCGFGRGGQCTAAWNPTMKAELGSDGERILTNLFAEGETATVGSAVTSLAETRGVPVDQEATESLLIDK